MIPYWTSLILGEAKEGEEGEEEEKKEGEEKDEEKGEEGEKKEGEEDEADATTKEKKPSLLDNLKSMKNQVHMPAFLTKKSSPKEKDPEAGDKEESKELLEKKEGEEEEKKEGEEKDEEKGEEGTEETPAAPAKESKGNVFLDSLRSVASHVPSIFKGKITAKIPEKDADIEAGEKVGVTVNSNIIDIRCYCWRNTPRRFLLPNSTAIRSTLVYAVPYSFLKTIIAPVSANWWNVCMETLLVVKTL